METKCICGCPWAQHLFDPDHHSERLGCVNCDDCNVFEEQFKEIKRRLGK